MTKNLTIKEREAVLFSRDRTLDDLFARNLRAACPEALEVLRAAPILSMALTQLKVEHPRGALWAVMSDFTRCVRRVKSVRKVLAEYDIPKPLARLPAETFSSRSASLLFRLRQVDPRALGTAVATVKDPRLWWSVLHAMTQQMSRRVVAAELDQSALTEWLAVKVAPCQHTAGLAELVDYFIAEGFNPSWTLDGALARSRAWHEDVVQARLNKRFENPDRLAETNPIWPAEIVFEGLDFELLNTPRKLFNESQAMSHCVGSYWADVKGGKTVIYSIKDADENRLATAEYFLDDVGCNWVIGQCAARFNADPAPEVTNAAVKFVAAVMKNGAAR